MSEAEGDELLFEVAHAVLHVTAALQLLQLHTVLVQPLTIGMGLGQLFFNLAVIVYLALLRVDEQDFAWLQAALADYVARLEVHHADL